MGKFRFILIISLVFAIWLMFSSFAWGDEGQYTSLALDSNNYSHISYYDVTNGDLKYKKWNGTSWDIMVVDSTGDVGQYTSIALASDDSARISYYDVTNGDLKYATYDTVAATWHTVTVDSTGDVGQYTSLALASDDSARIAYYDVDGTSLEYAKWNGATWEIETVDTKLGTYCSLALDSNEYPHISYYKGSGTNLDYAKWNGSIWVFETVESPGSVGQYTSIALDSNDYPHISYYDSANSALKYAKWNGTTWDITIIDSIDSVGTFTSIVDSEGIPYISYYDATNFDLKLAKWSEALSDWVVTTVVASTDDVGQYNSLAVDSSGYVYISYYNATTGNLEYYTSAITLGVILLDASATSDYTTWAIGQVAETSIIIMATHQSVYVKNTGTVNEDFRVSAAISPATGWSFGTTSVSEDTCILMGLFSGDTLPLAASFATTRDIIIETPREAGSGPAANYWTPYGTGDNVASLDGEKFYIYFQAPDPNTSPTEHTITVTIEAKLHD